MFGRSDKVKLDGAGFTKDFSRLLLHHRFSGVANVDGAGDQGADIVADRGPGGPRWVFQCKYISSGAVGEAALTEVLNGRLAYGADRAAIVTNRTFTSGLKARVDALSARTGLSVELIDGGVLESLSRDPGMDRRLPQRELRPYQLEAFARVNDDLGRRRRALLVLATGLGKTVVAGSCIDRFIASHPSARVLVVAPGKELVDQLERALWWHLTKDVPTQVVTGDSRPELLEGVTCATPQSAWYYVQNGWRPDFVVIDEAHHVGQSNELAGLIAACAEVPLLGVTATPWRGDGFNLENVFGPASYKLGIEDGMRLGFLCDVEYKAFADNIDWNFVRLASRKGYSIRELNQKLFLPQRDEVIRDRLLEAWNRVSSPKAIVFCQSVAHAHALTELLRAVPQWAGVRALHADVSRRDRQRTLLDFRTGRLAVLVAVDVLNEGVDVPDVNLVCFARVTHSRRIFVQQLGRGLRVAPDKDRVVVLDFISDVRRAAQVCRLKSAVRGDDVDRVVLPSTHRIEFTDLKVEGFVQEWIRDAADLDTADDQAQLSFPAWID